MMKWKLLQYALLLTLLAPAASARFSKFACISPDTPNPDGALQVVPEVTFSSAAQDQVTVRVTIAPRNQQYDGRQCWLIICKKPVNPDRQDFRHAILLPKQPRDDIERITPLTAAPGVSPSAGGAASAARSIAVQLSRELASRAYIYIDYPSPVMDGGYYFSIDIPSYLRRLKGE